MIPCAYVWGLVVALTSLLAFNPALAQDEEPSDAPRRLSEEAAQDLDRDSALVQRTRAELERLERRLQRKEGVVRTVIETRANRHRVDLFEGAQAFTIKVADLEDEGYDPRDVESKSADQAVLDAQFAEAALRDIVTSHDKVLADPEPMVKLHELDDSSMNFIVRPWVNTGGY